MPRTAGTKQLNLDLPTELLARLEAQAIKEDRAKTVIIRRVLEKYLDDEEKVDRKKLVKK